jgi:hypothetical protein
MYELKGEPTPLGREDDTGGHVSAAVSEAAVPTQTGSCTRSSCTNTDTHVSAAVSEAAVPTQTGTAQQLYQHRQLYQQQL